jgi:hypothetical protein
MNMKNPLVDIVVCQYNNKELTIKCLDSLLKSEYADFRIVVVDDCSSDGSIVFLKEKYPKIDFIQNSKNLGTALTRNAGINICRSKYLVTMDNDAELSPYWLGQMVELMEENSQIGQAVGKILFGDRLEIIAAAGGSMYFRGKSYDLGFGAASDDIEYNIQKRVLYACSASMIVRRDVFDSVGGFYGGYYHGNEDTDLSLRINIAGFDVVYNPIAVSYHLLSATVNNSIQDRKKVYLFMRNRLLIMLRNYEFFSLIKYLPLNLRFNLRLCFSDFSKLVPFLASLASIVPSFSEIWQARKQINSKRKVSDDQLASLFNQH